MRSIAIAAAVAASLLAQACAAQPTPAPAAAAADARASAPADANAAILAALRQRRYADAIAAARLAPVDRVEIDFAVGELVLQGLSDPQAVQRPLESVETGLSLTESAALAGHTQAIASLAATFATGLRADVGGAPLVAPDAALQACWEAAKARPAGSAGCIARRKRR